MANAPFASGTDESIRYVAFAAAKNRWATEEDFHRYGIEHFYYSPSLLPSVRTLSGAMIRRSSKPTREGAKPDRNT